jgi:hypothetical protein
MEKINYNLKMQEIIKQNEMLDKIPTLLLHTCCAPCSSSVILRLSQYFKITVLYYNPNIEPQEEYEKRKEEQKRFLKEFSVNHPVSFLDCDYEHEAYESISHGLEKEKEGGARCPKCFMLRLEKTAQLAKEHEYDYFGTSLTVSPYKNAQMINEIGSSLEKKWQVKYLYSDFKKNDGYKKSIELSKQYHLYRQDYCGCRFSKEEREQYKARISQEK